ncbi:MAG: 23S rRNA (uracil(1939)-C(5))-methyltransferase RlmD [Candidatus Azobacteroides sp.]|nr:23S rRNA (uracil(1939)-C(5))-methyltransferase RlmD [Candidatus Azobacteroides sp.]
MSKKKTLPILEKISVTGIAAEGKAIAKYNEMAVFIPFVVPGDVVDVQLTRKRNRYAEGIAIRFHQYAPQRAKAFCEHYGVCGGCKWQILSYSEQIRYKQQQVADHLLRIGKISLPEISPILGSEKTQFYRNKLEYTFSNKRWLTPEEIQSGLAFDQMNALGFHIPGMFDKVLDIKQCFLQAEPSNSIRLEIKKICLENQYAFFDLKNQQGFMRNLIIRTSTTGEVMLIVVFYEDHPEKRDALLNCIAEKFPEITSLLYIINSKANDTITDQTVHVFKGKDHIFEEMEGLKFKIGPKSFYQTNSEQAYRLYQIVRDFADLTGEERVYDLYTGTGTIACFVSRKAKQVIGIEYVPEAVADAETNAEINGVTNALFFAGDMKDILNQNFIEKYGRPDVIITDPPRTGMHSDVVDAILLAAPQRIVYVSCNPATQARDLNLLDKKYQTTKIQPVDMFPHTYHVENVVLLNVR